MIYSGNRKNWVEILVIVFDRKPCQTRHVVFCSFTGKHDFLFSFSSKIHIPIINQINNIFLHFPSEWIEFSIFLRYMERFFNDLLFSDVTFTKWWRKILSHVHHRRNSHRRSMGGATSKIIPSVTVNIIIVNQPWVELEQHGRDSLMYIYIYSYIPQTDTSSNGFLALQIKNKEKGKERKKIRYMLWLTCFFIFFFWCNNTDKLSRDEIFQEAPLYWTPLCQEMGYCSHQSFWQIIICIQSFTDLLYNM